MESKDTIYQRVYDQLMQAGRIWRKYAEDPGPPTYDAVRTVVENMILLVAENPDSISVESGGILVKRTDGYIDIYVHAGGIKE